MGHQQENRVYMYTSVGIIIAVIIVSFVLENIGII